MCFLLTAFFPRTSEALIAFKNYIPYPGFLGSDWEGFDHFRFLFGSRTAWTITYNTIFMKANLIESFKRGVVESRYQYVYQTQGKVLCPLPHQRLNS